jgi:hypothetical protein
MTDYKVIIPEEKHSLIDFRQDALPGVAVVNSALRTFESRIVFSWHLSLMITFDDLIDNGMPSRSERDVVDPFFNKVDLDIKGDIIKPNGLFLARITWNATRELIWRIFDPEIANNYLTRIIESNTSPRQFEYRIDNDPDWKLCKWHLKNA